MKSHAVRLTAALCPSCVLITCIGVVYMAWELVTPSCLGGMTPEPNDGTVIFFVGGLIPIWSAPKLWQQITGCILVLLGIWQMHSLLPPL